MEKQRCPNATATFDPKYPSDPDACVVWRRFAKYVQVVIFKSYSVFV
jgi:hypothetical protein